MQLKKTKMTKNNCLENLRTYKLEHQAWFNDIHKRLNLLLVDKKKVKFESLEKVASKWIIPVASDLKNLEGITEIQKLILVEVQEYKKIIDLIKKTQKGSFFKSKEKLLQKRDVKIVMHADAMSTAHGKIVKSFNDLEKNIITGNLTCKTVITAKKQADQVTVKNTEKAKENPKKEVAKSVTKEVTTKKQIDTPKKELAQKISEKTSLAKPTTSSLSSSLNTEKEGKKETPKKEVTTTAVENIKTTTTKETKPISNTTLSMENMLNQDLLNTLNSNRNTKNNDTQTKPVQEIFNLQEEIKRIIG